MKNPTSPILLLLAFCMFVPTDLFAAKLSTLSGIIYRDTNGNNNRDRLEKGGPASIIWLYRVLPNGAVQRVRQVYTNASGSYKIPRVPYGTYFLSIKYLTEGGTPIRTANFNVNTSSARRFTPLVTSATLLSNPLYAAAYTSASNPDRLIQGPNPTTPFVPTP